MGNWARQGDLNDKLGGNVKLNSSDNYWPTKSQILENWNAEISGTYADNQWCDIDNVKEGSVDIYKRFYKYTTLLYDELFEDIVGPKKCDICLVSGGGASGKWSGWGSGFGAPGGGGQVYSVLDIYFEYSYRADAYVTITVGIGGTNINNAVKSFFYLKNANVVLNRDYFCNTEIGRNGERGLGGLSTDSVRNTNGAPGTGGGGVVNYMTYTNPITAEGASINIKKTFPKSTNTAYFWKDRGETYDIPDGIEFNYAIPEFDEDDLSKAVTHGAPGHIIWHSYKNMPDGTKIDRIPNKYISSCPFNNGKGSLIINDTRYGGNDNMNRGGRGGGGAGGGAGGSDYNSGSYGSGYSFDGGNGAVIVRYKAKRFFPADKNWIIKMTVGNIQLKSAYAFGILLEGKYFIYMGKDIKYDNGTIYKDAPIQKYLQNEYTGTTITWEKEIPADFHPTKVWLIVAKDSDDLNKDDVYWQIISGTTVINDNHLYKRVAKRFLLDNIRNDYKTCKDSISRYEKDNQALSYIDITDVFKTFKPNNITNEYTFKINTGNYVYRSLRCASSLLPEGVGVFPITKISAKISVTNAVLTTDMYTSAFRDKTGELCYLFGLNVGNRDIFKPSTTESPEEYYEVTFTFDVPSGYKLRFNENVILGGLPFCTVLSKTNDSITIKFYSTYFNPNTDLRHCDYGHVFGEYGCELLGETWVTRTYQFNDSTNGAIRIDQIKLLTVIVKNKNSGQQYKTRINPNTDKGISYSVNINEDSYDSSGLLIVGFIFSIPDDYSISIGGSGSYNIIGDKTVTIEQGMSSYNPDVQLQNIGTYNLRKFEKRRLQYIDNKDEIGTQIAAFGLKNLKAYLNTGSDMVIPLTLVTRDLGVIQDGNSYYINFQIDTLAVDWDTIDYNKNTISVEFYFDRPSGVTNPVKLTNVIGLPNIKYLSDTNVIVYFNPNVFKPNNNTKYDIVGKYMLLPPDKEYIIKFHSNGTYSQIMLFKSGYQPLNSLTYFAITLPSGGGTANTQLKYNRSGTKGFAVNAIAGKDDIATFGDTVYVYAQIGLKQYKVVDIIELNGKLDVYTSEIM